MRWRRDTCDHFVILAFDVVYLKLPDVLEHQGLSLNFLLKPIMSLILEKHHVVLEYFLAPLEILEYFLNCSFLNY